MGCPGSRRRDLGEPPLEIGDEVLERDVVEIDAALPPELVLDRLRAREAQPTSGS